MAESYQPNIRIKGGLKLSDVMSQNGATFEIDLDDLLQNQENDEPEGTRNYEEMYPHLRPACCDLEDDEVYEGAEPFDKIAKNMRNVLEDGKIKKKILSEGHGDVVGDQCNVVVDYNAYVEYNDEPFDSTYLRKRPFRFQLGKGDSLTGIDLSVKTMKLGEKAQFLVHSDYAYGDLGCLKRIPPKAWILFEIELKNFTNATAAESANETVEEQKTFEKIQAQVLSLCSNGKELYTKGMIWQAAKEYNIAVGKLEFCTLKDKEQEDVQQKLLLRLYSNLVVCYTKLQEPRRACKNYNKISQMCKDSSLKISAKVYFNHARCMAQLGDFNYAEKQLRKAQRLEPNNVEISQEFARINSSARDNYNRELAIAKSMFVNNEINIEPEDKTKVTKEFETSITQFCLDLLNDKENTRYGLPDNLVAEELEFIKNEVVKHGLKFEKFTRKPNEKDNYFIVKPLQSSKDNENASV